MLWSHTSGDMNYRTLLAALKELTEEQLDMTVTVCDNQGEFFPVSDCFITDGTDVLDDNHPYLKIQE